MATTRHTGDPVRTMTAVERWHEVTAWPKEFSEAVSGSENLVPFVFAGKIKLRRTTICRAGACRHWSINRKSSRH